VIHLTNAGHVVAWGSGLAPASSQSIGKPQITQQASRPSLDPTSSYTINLPTKPKM
jgi:hypothetical protein